MKSRTEFIVYIVGISLFGMLYVPITGLLGNSQKLIIALIAYVIVLRFAGRMIAKHTEKQAEEPTLVADNAPTDKNNE